MAKKVNIGGVYIDIGLEQGQLRADLQKVKQMSKVNAGKIQKDWANLKVDLNTALLKAKVSDVRVMAKELRAELQKKIKMNVDLASIEETRVKLETVESALRGIDEQNEKTSGSFGKNAMSWIKNLSIVTVAVGALRKAYNFLVDSVSTASEFEQLKTRLENLYQSADKAKKVFKEIKKVASTTPYSLKGVTEATVQAKAFGIEAEKNIKQIADLAAFMGVDIVEAASAMGRAFAGGAGAADILRERGVLNLIKSFTGIEDLTKLTLPEFRKAMIHTFEDPAAGIAGATDKLSKDFVGKVSNMKDAWDSFIASVGDKINPLLGQLAQGIGSVLTALTPVEDKVKNVQVEAAKQRIEFDNLTATYIRLRTQTQLTAEQKKILAGTIKTLQDKYPNYFKNLDLEKDKLGKVKDAIKDARAELDLYLQSKVEQALLEEKLTQKVENNVKIDDLSAKVEKLKSGQETGDTSVLPRGSQIKADAAGKGSKTYDNIFQSFIKGAEREIEDFKKQQEELQLEIEKTQKAISEEFSGVTAPTNTVPENKKVVASGGGKGKDALKDLEDAQKEVFNTLKWKAKEYYDYRVGLIDKEADELQKVYEKSGKSFDVGAYKNEKMSDLSNEMFSQVRDVSVDDSSFENIWNKLNEGMKEKFLDKPLEVSAKINSDDEESLLASTDSDIANQIAQTENDSYQQQISNEQKYQNLFQQRISAANQLANALSSSSSDFLSNFGKALEFALQIAQTMSSLSKGGDAFSNITGLFGSAISLLGLKEGGSVSNFGGGNVSYTPHKKAAFGLNNFKVPGGFYKDDYIVGVKTGETINVTPNRYQNGGSNNFNDKNILAGLSSLRSSFQGLSRYIAGSLANQPPIAVTLKVGDKELAKAVQSQLNRLLREGNNLSEL